MKTIKTKRGQSVFDAAKEAGYIEPEYRVGVVPDAKPLPREEMIARIRAEHYGRGYPVFKRVLERR